jgi:hypothetical protein
LGLILCLNYWEFLPKRAGKKVALVCRVLNGENPSSIAAVLIEILNFQVLCHVESLEPKSRVIYLENGYESKPKQRFQKVFWFGHLHQMHAENVFTPYF